MTGQASAAGDSCGGYHRIPNRAQRLAESGGYPRSADAQTRITRRSSDALQIILFEIDRALF
jgi:hypothetical protein